MAMKHLDRIASELVAAGREASEPVAIVSNASLPDQQVLETTLAQAASDAATHGIQPPAIVCIGRAVLLRQALDWASQLDGARPRTIDPLGTRAERLDDVS